MTVEVKVPVLPESVADATVVTWHKKAGEQVSRDENLVDLETDKIVLEVPAPSDGVLVQILKEDGVVVLSNEVLAMIDPSASADKVPTTKQATPEAAPAVTQVEALDVSPAVRRLVSEHNIDITKLQGTGKGNRISKDDVLKFIKSAGGQPQPSPAAAAPIVGVAGERQEKRVPMSRLRAKVAERLLQVQQNAAILTTFNEVDLKSVVDLRKKHKEKFEQDHGVRLGFMSFFTKAVVEALKRFPAVNASIDEKDIIYHGYFDIGIAVSTERGLVVPVLRDVDQMSMGIIEKQITQYAERARNNQLTIEEMTGGTFTITNGGVFGSLLSTPILNPPQSAILGMHKIEERAVVKDGEIVIRPMMYLALSYDHRLIDGKESVQFLVTLKELLEEPGRMLLEI